MSRATWYRRGKPTEKPPKRQTQAAFVKRGGSVRTLQRALRISRAAPDLMQLVMDGQISIGKAEALVRDTVVGDGFVMLPKLLTE